jgi:hypothetical protein
LLHRLAGSNFAELFQIQLLARESVLTGKSFSQERSVHKPNLLSKSETIEWQQPICVRLNLNFSLCTKALSRGAELWLAARHLAYSLVSTL